MALPTGVSLGTFTSGIDGISVAWGSHAANDTGILIVETANQPIDAPTGWTEFPDSPIGQGTAGAAGAVAIQGFWKLAASGAEAAVSLPDAGDHIGAKIITVRGCDRTEPDDVTAASTSSGTSLSLPSVTTSAANRHIIQIVGTARDFDSTANFTGWTNAGLSTFAEREDKTVSSGVGGGFGIVTGDKAAAGSIGTTTVTQATSSNVAMLTIALQPPSVFALDSAAIVVSGVELSGLRSLIASLDDAAIALTGVALTHGVYGTPEGGTPSVYAFNLEPGGIVLYDYNLGPTQETRINTQIEYHPGPVPYDVKMIPQYLVTELAKIQAAISRIRDEKQDIP